MRRMSGDAVLYTIYGTIIGVLIFGSAGLGWYRASVQVEVYRRQGVEMSTWEVFMGAKPVERYLKEAP